MVSLLTPIEVEILFIVLKTGISTALDVTTIKRLKRKAGKQKPKLHKRFASKNKQF
jgi:hypothetical protein